MRIIDGNSIVSGRNNDSLASIMTRMLTSRPFPELCRLYDIEILQATHALNTAGDPNTMVDWMIELPN